MTAIKPICTLILSLFTAHLFAEYPSGILPVDSVRYYITQIQASYDTVNNYTCVFHKQERIDGDLQPQELMQMKFRKPRQIYLKWIREPYKGRELLYREGWNENKLRVKQAGFPYVTLNLDPTGTLAMKGNRHPVTQAGLGAIIHTLAKDFRESAQHPSDSVQYFNKGSHTIYRRTCLRLIADMPARVSNRYYAHQAVIDIDLKNHLPIHLMIMNDANQLIEEYGFEDLRLNPGLTRLDFSPENPGYGF